MINPCPTPVLTPGVARTKGAMFLLLLVCCSKKFKSRCGDYAGLKEFLDEGLKHSTDCIKNSNKGEVQW